MQVKDRVLDALEAQRGTYLSGQALAEKLQVSRSAVWKAIEQLREKGYPIQAVPHRGYCLGPEHRPLAENPRPDPGGPGGGDLHQHPPAPAGGGGGR